MPFWNHLPEHHHGDGENENPGDLAIGKVPLIEADRVIGIVRGSRRLPQAHSHHRVSSNLGEAGPNTGQGMSPQVSGPVDLVRPEADRSEQWIDEGIHYREHGIHERSVFGAYHHIPPAMPQFLPAPVPEHQWSQQLRRKG